MQKLKNEPVGFIFKNVCYVYQKVAAGLNYLHHKGLVHGDIKGMLYHYNSELVLTCNRITLNKIKGI